MNVSDLLEQLAPQESRAGKTTKPLPFPSDRRERARAQKPQLGPERRRQARRLRGPARRGSREAPPAPKEQLAEEEDVQEQPQQPPQRIAFAVPDTLPGLDAPRTAIKRRARVASPAARQRRVQAAIKGEREKQKGVRQSDARVRRELAGAPEWQRIGSAQIPPLNAKYLYSNLNAIWERAKEIYAQAPPSLKRSLDAKYPFEDKAYFTRSGDKEILREYAESKGDSDITPTELLNAVGERFSTAGEPRAMWGDPSTCDEDIYCPAAIMRNLIEYAALTAPSALSEVLSVLADEAPFYQKQWQAIFGAFGRQDARDLVHNAVPLTLSVLELMTAQPPIGTFGDKLLKLDWNNVARALQSFGNTLLYSTDACLKRGDCTFDVQQLYQFFVVYFQWLRVTEVFTPQVRLALGDEDYFLFDWGALNLEVCKRLQSYVRDPLIGGMAASALADACVDGKPSEKLQEMLTKFFAEENCVEHSEMIARCAPLLLTVVYANQFPIVKQMDLPLLPMMREVGGEATGAESAPAQEQQPFARPPGVPFGQSAPAPAPTAAPEPTLPTEPTFVPIDELPTREYVNEQCAVIIFGSNDINNDAEAQRAIENAAQRGDERTTRVFTNCLRVLRGEEGTPPRDEIFEMVNYAEEIIERGIQAVQKDVAPLGEELEQSVLDQCANRILYSARIWGEADIEPALQELRKNNERALYEAATKCIDHFRGERLTREEAESIVREGTRLAPDFGDASQCQVFLRTIDVTDVDTYARAKAILDGGFVPANPMVPAMFNACGATLFQGMPLDAETRYHLINYNIERFRGEFADVF